MSQPADVSARPVMLRLFILLLFAIAAFLPVGPNMQELVAHTASLTKASAAGMRTAQGETTDPRPCGVRASGSSASDGCSATQTCATCNICQVCHQAAMVQTPLPAILTAFTWIAFPPTSAGNASAEHAPSFKPPILWFHLGRAIKARLAFEPTCCQAGTSRFFEFRPWYLPLHLPRALHLAF